MRILSPALPVGNVYDIYRGRKTDGVKEGEGREGREADRGREERLVEGGKRD